MELLNGRRRQRKEDKCLLSLVRWSGAAESCTSLQTAAMWPIPSQGARREAATRPPPGPLDKGLGAQEQTRRGNLGQRSPQLGRGREEGNMPVTLGTQQESGHPGGLGGPVAHRGPRRLGTLGPGTDKQSGMAATLGQGLHRGKEVRHTRGQPPPMGSQPEGEPQGRPINQGRSAPKRGGKAAVPWSLRKAQRLASGVVEPQTRQVMTLPFLSFGFPRRPKPFPEPFRPPLPLPTK